MKLEDLCRVFMLGKKPDGIDGSKVEIMVAEGRISEVAAYCEIDVVNTYQVWLHYQLFKGQLTRDQFNSSRKALRSFLVAQKDKRPHLAELLS
jgi:predicted PolB exonuclease-like 3'-5' exonuclease